MLVIAEVIGSAVVAMFAADFLEWAMGALDIDQETAADLPRIVDIMTKYADSRPISQMPRW